MTKNQQHGRADHRAVSVGDSLYAWAGSQAGLPREHDSEKKRRFTSNIEHFTLSTGEWITRGTTGTPSLGIIGYCCTAIKDLLYYFGGYCGHDICYHNSITQLDTGSLQWRELEPTDATRPVMKRGFGGMISFEHDGVHHLLMIGGLGSKPAVPLPHYKYIKAPNGRWRTNEHSIYNISSREWSNPSIIGQCIPSASRFIIEKINNTRAVLFGGVETHNVESSITNNIYILEISISTVFWQCIKKPEAIDQWPVGRMHHAGAIIITGSDCPMLVISGGWNKDRLKDSWIFNITQHSWIKLDVPHSVCKRDGHSLSVFAMSSHCVWLVTIGGYVDEIGTLITHPNTTILIELVTSSKGEWTVGDTLDTNGMNNEEYKKKYQQQLQLVRKIWLEEYHKPKKGADTADIEQTVKALIQSLEENEKKMQQKERKAEFFCQQMEQKKREVAEKDQEIRRYCHQLQEKDREEAEREERYHNQLQEKDRELQEKDRELQEKDSELHEKDRKLQEKDRELKENRDIQEKDRELQEMDSEEAEREERHHNQLQEEDRELQEKRVESHQNQLQEKEREKEELIQQYHYQLQEKEKEEVERKEHELQKIKELEKEIERLNQLLQNKDQELFERDQKLKKHLQQIQQHEHLKDINIQGEETRVDQEKVQEVKLLHSSEVALHDEQQINEVEQAKELQEEVKTTQKEDNGKGNQMHETQGCKNDSNIIIQLDKVVESVTEGAHVAEKNLFLIYGGSTQSVNWEKYGIRITIPQGAVLPSETVEVTITALVGGDFIFPEDTELVSAVYDINITKPFIEPVKLEIQHCVSIETVSQCSYLSFATATNNQPPYEFNTVDGGEFSTGNRYGSISIATFSKYCIKTYSGRRYQPYLIPGPSLLHEKTYALSSSLSSPPSPSVSPSPFNDGLHSSSSSLNFELPHLALSTKKEVTTLADEKPFKCYHSQVMYEIKRPGREWLMRFLLTKDLNALIEYIRKAFRNVEKSIEVFFQFKDDHDGFIELCFDAEKCPKGWSVRPHQDPTRVRQTAIDIYGSMSPPRFPECLITITATTGEGAVKELSYPVTLQGITKSNVEKINIVLTMYDIQQVFAGYIASNLAGPICQDYGESKVAGKVLRENFDTLSKILAAPNNLSTVIMSLYSKELIPDTTATECMNTGRPVQDRCASLLFALKATIDGKPQAMNTLIEVLKEKEAFKEIADKMDLEVSYRTYTNP